MRNKLVVTLVAGLAVASLGLAPAVAAKKKPKPAKLVPANVNFYLRAADCTADVFSLSILDEEGDGTCGSLENGAAQEVYAATGDPYIEQLWIAADGLPLTIDATKPLTGKIYVEPYLVSAGEATLDVTLTATLNGEAVEIGKASSSYMVTPATDTYEVAFEIDVPTTLDKQQITSLELHTVSRGQAPGHGYYEMEDPASFFTMPALVKR